jgi:hypothetical protein
MASMVGKSLPDISNKLLTPASLRAYCATFRFESKSIRFKKTLNDTTTETKIKNKGIANLKK